MSSFAQQERQALADLFEAVGSDAPTRCEGWQTRDLAAHLVVRERRPDAAGGLVVPALAGYLARVQRNVRDGRPWPALVATVRGGPPPPLRWVDEPLNASEFFIHHEDVRRATPGWEPRTLPAEFERMLWGRARLMGRLAGRKAGVGMVLEAPGYGRATVRKGVPSVTLTGAPGELLLFLSGRKEAARVRVDGDPPAVERLAGAPLGL